jgi:TRAP-type C4-dicarboxylate transport system permease small subunit
MRLTIKLLLAWFAFFGLAIGAWQQLAPESFYTNFPGLGHHWVSPDGPYNEHLLRDVGQGNLAAGTVALVALLAGGIWLVRATGLAAVIANVPHQIYHQTTVDILPTTTDQVLQSLTLSAVSVAAIALCVLAFSTRPDRFDRRPQADVARSVR